MKNDYSPKNNGRKKRSEFKGYLDKNGFAIGYEYEAIIELKGDWTTKETIAFVSQSFDNDCTIVLAIRKSKASELKTRLEHLAFDM